VNDQPDRRPQTPAEYLAEIRLAYSLRRHELEVQDPEFLRLTESALKELGENLPNLSDPFGPVMEAFVDELATPFKEAFQVDIRTVCAIGSLEHPVVNARCFRSLEGVYAIVLHHGLMDFLHKYTKLLAAAGNPAAVTYCNRKPAEQVTSEELREWWGELGAIYLATGEVGGARVKLAPEETLAATQLLLMSEAFVVGHELGHMIAGHLEDRSVLAADEEVPWLHFLPENTNHDYEFEADEYGFFAVSSYAPNAPKPLLLASLVTTFITMALIGADRNSETHPAAMDRLQALVERNFSQGTAALMSRWIEEGDDEAAILALDTAR
jgi:hypothetical protein